MSGANRLVRDGTATMLAGTLAAGIATYAWQAGGTRTLGETAFAPVANTWTLYFLVVTIVLVPIEQFTTRTVAAYRDGASQLARALPWIARLLIATAALLGLAAYLLRSSLFDGSATYALVTVAIVLSLGQLAICRGILVGRHKFASYGWLTGLDSVIRLLVGLPIVLATSSALAFVWTIPLASLVALAWLREWPRSRRAHGANAPDVADAADGADAPGVLQDGPAPVPVGRFLATTIGGTSAAQLLLAGGPLVLALLGASESAVSILFVTQTACRAAFLMATPACARCLPPLTRIAVRSDYGQLRRIALGVLAGSLAFAAAARWW